MFLLFRKVRSKVSGHLDTREDAHTIFHAENIFCAEKSRIIGTLFELPEDAWPRPGNGVIYGRQYIQGENAPRVSFFEKFSVGDRAMIIDVFDSMFADIDTLKFSSMPGRWFLCLKISAGGLIWLSADEQRFRKIC